jgi:hypothetical protein
VPLDLATLDAFFPDLETFIKRRTPTMIPMTAYYVRVMLDRDGYRDWLGTIVMEHAPTVAEIAAWITRELPKDFQLCSVNVSTELPLNF